MRYFLAGPALLLCGVLASAQQATSAVTQTSTDSSAVITLGRSAVPLYSPWKFTVGDSPIDPRTGQPLWAEPAFDDSQWETVDLTPKAGFQGPVAVATGLTPGWTLRGHPDYSGYAWYRIRVEVHAQPGDKLALAGPENFDDAYQVFQDGSLLGGFGRFEGKMPQYYYAQPVVLSLGAARDSENETATQVIAFRFWMSPRSLIGQSDAGGFHSAPFLGTAETMSAVNQLGWLQLLRTQLVWMLSGVVSALLTMIALALFAFNRDDLVYLWMGALFLAGALGDWETALAALTQTITVPTETWICFVLVIPAIRFFWAMVLWAWFRLQRPRWFPWAVALLALAQAASYAGGFYLLPFLSPAYVPICYVTSQAISFVFLLVLGWMAFHGVRKLGAEAWLLVLPLVLDWLDKVAAWLPFLHLSRAYAPFGIWINLQQIIGLAVEFCLCVLLVRRWVLAARAQRHMALDVKQAQEVQQVILPEARTQLPGLVIESEYRPAREVGGDFFQIIPNPTDGSLLIVAGDVTGKGLKAGMLVALLVGAIRSIAHFNADPLVMLQEMNQRLLGRGDAQATCLALRIDRDGSAILANAGHLAPYINGEPIEMEGALPLGMIDSPEFSVMRIKLGDRDRLVLMSDGIAEATDANGTLFGFERVHELLRVTSTASAVADAAQQFGQEDDISVISVTRTGLLTPAMA